MKPLRKILYTAILSTAFAGQGLIVSAQKVMDPPVTNKEWEQPYQPFRIAGNLYYVGTYDLASYLIVTPKGHILINTGVASSASVIRKNVEALGFHFNDIKILLATHAHYDHVGAMAAVKKMTGADMMINENDAQVLADGGNSDFIFGGRGAMFVPLQADRLLQEQDTVRFSGMQIVVLHHPGHTKGACSFLFDVKDDKRTWRVLIANMPSVLDEAKPGMATYPGIVQDYARTFASLKQQQFDIWLASHASQFKLHEKHKPGDTYNPAAFTDRAGYDGVLEDLEKDYKQKLGAK